MRRCRHRRMRVVAVSCLLRDGVRMWCEVERRCRSCGLRETTYPVPMKRRFQRHYRPRHAKVVL